MKSPQPFRFKQFSVSHYNSSMKVGVDGVLIGAWGEVAGDKGLDIGCGCGLIALMAAQRNMNCSITAIDIDPKSIEESTENVYGSPWRERIRVEQVDAGDFANQLKNQSAFDFILSNPPFFNSGIASPQSQREIARHEDSLSSEILLQIAQLLLREGGTLSFITPYSNKDLLAPRGMKLIRSLAVADRLGKVPKRIMLTYRKMSMKMSESDESVSCDPRISESLYIKNEEGEYTEEYKRLTRDFYLAF